MKHPCIELIIACSCCKVYEGFVKDLSKDYPEVTTKIYIAGQDFDYIPKYGTLTSTILVINEKEIVDSISKSTIREAFEKAKNSK